MKLLSYMKTYLFNSFLSYQNYSQTYCGDVLYMQGRGLCKVLWFYDKDS